MLRTVPQVASSFVSICLFFFAFSSVAIAQDEQRQGEVVSLPAIREELIDRVRKDQEARQRMIDATASDSAVAAGADAKEGLLQEMMEIDKHNREWLSEQIAVHGWLGKSKVGADGARAAWLLAQHADRDRAFQKECLRLMEEAGADEVTPTQLAYLTDRILHAEGKPQKYGTQVSLVNGEFQVPEVEDPDNLDARRAEIGLLPMAEYLEQLKDVYKIDSGDRSDGNSEHSSSPPPSNLQKDIADRLEKLAKALRNVEREFVLECEAAAARGDPLSYEDKAASHPASRFLTPLAELAREASDAQDAESAARALRELVTASYHTKMHEPLVKVTDEIIEFVSSTDTMAATIGLYTSCYEFLEHGWLTEVARTTARSAQTDVNRAHAGAVLAKHLLRWGTASEAERAEVQELLQSIRGSEFADQLSNVVAQLQYDLDHLQVGMLVPDRTAVDTTGEEFRLAGLRGQVVVIEFTAFWCGPCRELLPRTHALVSERKHEPFAMISVNYDESADAINDLMQEHGADWRHVLDDGLAERKDAPWQTEWNAYLGAFFVIDHEGILRGRLDLTHHRKGELAQLVDNLIAKARAAAN